MNLFRANPCVLHLCKPVFCFGQLMSSKSEVREGLAGSHPEAYGVNLCAQRKIGFEVASVKGDLLIIGRVNLLP